MTNKVKKYQGGDERQAAQGDLLCFAISREKVKDIKFQSLPKEGFAAALGEVTGHRHMVQVADRESLVEIAEDDNGVFIRVLKGGAKLTHEEHGAIGVKTAPKIFTIGDWYIARQNEWSELEEYRRVAD